MPRQLLLALPHGRFTFRAGAPPAAPTIQMAAEELQAHLDHEASQHACMCTAIPLLASVPEIVAPVPPLGPAQEEVCDGSALETLLAIDGQRTVEAIIGNRGLSQRLKALQTLVELGVVRLAAPSVGLAAAGPPDLVTDGRAAPANGTVTASDLA
jgi:hypothetical protein